MTDAVRSLPLSSRNMPYYLAFVWRLLTKADIGTIGGAEAQLGTSLYVRYPPW